MRRIYKILMVFSLGFLAILSSCGNSYVNKSSIVDDDHIGFSTDSESRESHDVEVFYGVPEETIFNYLDYYEGFSLDNNFDCDAEMRIIRKNYKDTMSKECSSKEIYSETNKVSYYYSTDFIYGKHSIKDTINKDEITYIDDGYGYIVYEFSVYLLEFNPKYNNNDRVITCKSVELFYTFDGDKITFKINDNIVHTRGGSKE